MKVFFFFLYVTSLKRYRILISYCRTFIVGYGTPPEERFSNLVIMIIMIGLGLPMLIMLITALYICIRRMPKRVLRQGEVYVNR